MTAAMTAALTAYQVGRALHIACSKKLHHTFEYIPNEGLNHLCGLLGTIGFGAGLVAKNPLSFFSKTVYGAPFAITRFLYGKFGAELTETQEALCGISAIALHYAVWRVLHWSVVSESAGHPNNKDSSTAGN